MTDAEGRRGGATPADQAEKTPDVETEATHSKPSNARDVIGHRGYDEPDDETETETETEQH